MSIASILRLLHLAETLASIDKNTNVTFERNTKRRKAVLKYFKFVEDEILDKDKDKESDSERKLEIKI